MARILLFSSISITLAAFSYLFYRLGKRMAERKHVKQILSSLDLTLDSPKQLVEAKTIFEDLLHFDISKPEDDIINPETRKKINDWKTQYNQSLISLRRMR